MTSKAINKPDNVVRILGLGSLFCCGLAVGLSVHPVYNMLENQDLKRELDHTQSTLSDRNTEIEAKDGMTDEFCKEFKGIK
ncbi:MAG: hypothetical protein ACOVOV_18770 [Dolichospermum sp.]